MTSITIKEYFADAASRFTDKDARIVGPVLCELSHAGDIDAAAVVEAARSPQCALHAYFEWDDAKAASIYREGRAKEMLNAIKVRVISSGVERTTKAYTIATLKPLPIKYKNVSLPREAVQFDEDEILGDALSELQRWQIKYRPYAEKLAAFSDATVIVCNQIAEFLYEYQEQQSKIDTITAIADLKTWADRYAASTAAAGQFVKQFEYIFDAIKEAQAAFDPDTTIEPALIRENRILRERIAELEGTYSPVVSGLAQHFGLTRSEAVIVSALMDRQFMSKQGIMHAVYADHHPDIKIVDVYICKIRAKMLAFDVTIKTIWGVGYAIDPDMKARLVAILDRQSEAA